MTISFKNMFHPKKPMSSTEESNVTFGSKVQLLLSLTISKIIYFLSES